MARSCFATFESLKPSVLSRRKYKALYGKFIMTTINLETETTVVEELEVSCDGGGGVLGHPKVFLNLESGEVQCPYCDRRFVNLSTGTGADKH